MVDRFDRLVGLGQFQALPAQPSVQGFGHRFGMLLEQQLLGLGLEFARVAFDFLAPGLLLLVVLHDA
jgi:hypothetical protein